MGVGEMIWTYVMSLETLLCWCDYFLFLTMKTNIISFQLLARLQSTEKPKTSFHRPSFIRCIDLRHSRFYNCLLCHVIVFLDIIYWITNKGLGFKKDRNYKYAYTEVKLKSFIIQTILKSISKLDIQNCNYTKEIAVLSASSVLLWLSTQTEYLRLKRSWGSQGWQMSVGSYPPDSL